MNDNIRGLIERLRGGKCPDCAGWGEVAYFGETVGCTCLGRYEQPISMATRAEAADRIASLEAEVAALRDVVLVSERFLNACNSAWASGEPAHRVITMVNLADELRAALLNRGET